MDEPTDPPARQLGLTALTTEHFNLQTARMGTIAESNGRSTLLERMGVVPTGPLQMLLTGRAWSPASTRSWGE